MLAVEGALGGDVYPFVKNDSCDGLAHGFVALLTVPAEFCCFEHLADAGAIDVDERLDLPFGAPHPAERAAGWKSPRLVSQDAVAVEIDGDGRFHNNAWDDAVAAKEFRGGIEARLLGLSGRQARAKGGEELQPVGILNGPVSKDDQCGVGWDGRFLRLTGERRKGEEQREKDSCGKRGGSFDSHEPSLNPFLPFVQ